ncbi:MAG: ABC transporter permease [Gemmatimonadota bacterium]|nr:ABC transporter permease [Gemmatimonadota bacterium]
MPGGPWWRIGWRNLGRNRRRSLIAASMLAVGYFSCVALMGWADGLVAEMIGNGTGILTGQLQIHASDYLPDRSVYETIGGRDGTNVRQLVEQVAADPDVDAAAPRVYGGGLISSGSATAAAMFLGVDPDLELHVSRIMNALVSGEHPAAGANEVLVGTEIARTLGVSPGDEVVVVAPAIDGSLGNDLFVVSGVFESGLAELDRSFALLPIDALQALMVLPPSRVHEIAAFVRDPWQAPAAAARLDSLIRARGLDVAAESWTTIRPEMVEYAQLTQSFQWVLLLIVFGMAIFGVANTMLMATFERRYEFAVLKALGTTPSGIVGSVLSEALALGAIGLVGGAAVTFPIMVWWHLAPPDMSWLFGDFTMLGALIRPVLRVEYPWTMTVGAAVALFLTTVLAALYPALRSARIPPADTLAGR